MGGISWLNLPHGRGDPATHATVVVPSDTVALPTPAKTLWSGSGGTLKVLLYGDTVPVVLTNVPPGVEIRLSAVQVFATGTTCTNLLAFS